MARSIHTTYRHVADVLADRYLDREEQRDEARRLRGELRAKRLIKAQVIDERRPGLPEGPVVDPATVPILVEDAGELIHHGASAAEIVEVLRRLPPGVADGVAAIRLGLGRELQRDPDDGDQADPLVGRR